MESPKFDPLVLTKKLQFRRQSNSIISQKTSFKKPHIIPPNQKIYPKTPQYVIDEINFLRFLASFLFHKYCASEEEIIQEFQSRNHIPYKTLFGNIHLNFLLDFRDGLYYDNEEKKWYCEHFTFTRHIHQLHISNIKEYGKGYDI